jgi:hypothetical protein
MTDYTEAELAELRASEPYRQYIELHHRDDDPLSERVDRIAAGYADRQLGLSCERCHQHTGNNHQGHFWAYCKVTGRMEAHHFCCPDDCQLVAIAEGREKSEHAACGRPMSEHTDDECPPPL